MPENPDLITALMLKYMDGLLAPDEQVLLDQWIASSEDNKQIWKEINDKELLQESLKDYAQKATIFQSYKQSAATVVPIPRSFHRKYWYAAAAILLLITTTCAYLFFFRQPQTTSVVHEGTKAAPDVPPGGPKAWLTLADGYTLLLEDAANGQLAQQSDVSVNKPEDGLLRYDVPPSTGGIPTAMVYNTVTTPKGGSYRIILPDGTTAWLNAASSIHFPVNTTPSYRLAEITGEVYFEVKKDIHRSFFVKILSQKAGSNNTVVQVLGTHFNVNAYGDKEQIDITLLEGRLRVKTSMDKNKLDVQNDQRRKELLLGAGLTLKPGERAITHQNDTPILVEATNAKNAISWVNGEFYFNRESLSEVMRQLERWYDVNFVYDPAKINIKETYEGYIPRTMPLSKVLQRLERIGDVQFRLEGKTVIVQP